MLKNPAEAYALLDHLGAPARLIQHARLVAESAGRLLIVLGQTGIALDAETIELGAILHDAGKIKYPEELAESGSLHEGAGQALLLAHGVHTKVARCCATHGVWNLSGVSLEERIVALADKLWKGKREADLELSVIDEVAARLGCSRWELFESLDTSFEEIAAGGFERLGEQVSQFGSRGTRAS
jgi:hypothetical protein